MLLSMLKAVRNMIYIPVSPEIPPEVWKAKIECARDILDEIISSLTPTTTLTGYPISENPKPVSRETKQASTPQLQSTATLEPQPEVEIPANKEWLVTVDDKKNLYIEGFPEDGIVELDGKKMKYSETRGIKFQKAKIL